MVTHAQDGLRFVPSAVEGLPAVTEAAVFPDRLELLSEGKWVIIRFLDIARWYRHGWLFRPLAQLGLGVRGWPSVADRDWFHPPSGRFFRFFTTPPTYGVHARRATRDKLWADHVQAGAGRDGRGWVQHLRPRVARQAEPAAGATRGR
jgi:hypothetical protein